MVVSGADRSITTVLRGAQMAVQGPVTIADPATPLGNVVYVLKSIDGATPRWSAIAYEGAGHPPVVPDSPLFTAPSEPADAPSARRRAHGTARWSGRSPTVSGVAA